LPARLIGALAIPGFAWRIPALSRLKWLSHTSVLTVPCPSAINLAHGTTDNRVHPVGRFTWSKGRFFKNTYPLWLFGTSSVAPSKALIRLNKGNGSARAVQSKGRYVKKLALAVALVVAGLSLGGCFVGKGKAPAPVITKG
jgi:hypothetical protein